METYSQTLRYACERCTCERKKETRSQKSEKSTNLVKKIIFFDDYVILNLFQNLWSLEPFGIFSFSKNGLKSKKKKDIMSCFLYRIVFIMFRLFLLLSMVVVSIWISFADFQSEWKACGGSSSISSCYEKVNKKYIVSKTSACNLQNDIVTNKPIQTLRAKEKTLTTSFYKYNSKLFYQVAVSKDQKLTADKVTSYMYMYDCKKKKSYDLSTNLPKSFLHIWDVISADGEVLRFWQSVQFNKWKIFFESYLLNMKRYI